MGEASLPVSICTNAPAERRLHAKELTAKRLVRKGKQSWRQQARNHSGRTGKTIPRATAGSNPPARLLLCFVLQFFPVSLYLPEGNWRFITEGRKCENGGFEVEEDSYEGSAALAGRCRGCPPATGAGGTRGCGQDGVVRAAGWRCGAAPTPGFWGGQVWLGGGKRAGQPLRMMKGDAGEEKGEGAAPMAQQWRGARRRCWVQHQGMDATPLCLSSQHIWDWPRSAQLVGAAWRKRNLLQPH